MTEGVRFQLLHSLPAVPDRLTTVFLPNRLKPSAMTLP